jgi:hypothetical protein
MAIQPGGGFSGRVRNINAPRRIVIASSNAGMNRVLEEVYLTNHPSAVEKLLIPVEVRRNEIAEFDRTGRKVSIVDPSYS